jgi:hypothetical protein
LSSVTNSPNLSATALPALEEQEQHDSAAAHAPAISPDTPHEAETAPKDEDVRAIASAFDGPSTSASHGPSSSVAPDYKRMSKDDVQKLKPNQLRNSLVAMAPDEYKAFQKKLTEGQRKVADDFFREVDEDTGIATPTHQQNPVQQQTIQQPLRPAARTGPNKLRKNPPPGYTPPDYTEYRRLQGTPPRPGQGVLSRAVELKAAKNKARGESFPRFNATLDVATSPTALGIAAKKTAQDLKEAGSNLISKLRRPDTGGEDEGNS